MSNGNDAGAAALPSGALPSGALPSGARGPTPPARAEQAPALAIIAGGPDTTAVVDPDDIESAQVHAIVARVQAGDGAAYGELYDRYANQVYRYIYYRVASRQLAEDLTSETFLRALRRIGSFTWQGRDIGAWFITIARNLVADHYKSSRYRLELIVEDVAAAAPALSVAGPEDEVLAGLRDAALLTAVRSLGAEQQECVVLRFLHGLSVAETARVMGKNDAAVKALQYRAVKSLGRLLEGVEL